MNAHKYFLGYWDHWSESRQLSLHILFIATVIFLVLPITLPSDGQSVLTINLLLAFWQSISSGVVTDVVANTAQGVILVLLTKYLLTVGAVFVIYLLIPTEWYQEWRHKRTK